MWRGTETKTIGGIRIVPANRLMTGDVVSHSLGESHMTVATIRVEERNGAGQMDRLHMTFSVPAVGGGTETVHRECAWGREFRLITDAYPEN